jgi:hypothetical protein
MKKRRALLIGVPEYDSEFIPPLPVVCRDIQRLEEVLKSAEFEVQSKGINDEDTTKAKIHKTIREECKKAQSGETLLLYFAGYGVNLGGKDYLLPWEAVVEDAQLDEEFLLSCDRWDDVFAQSKAETIIFFIDACRQGLDAKVQGLSLERWSHSLTTTAKQSNYLRVFSCGSGQFSGVSDGEQGLSFFCQALAEVLDPKHSACELGEILRATQARLNQLTDAHNRKRQNISFLKEDIANDILSRVIIPKDTLRTTSQADERWRVEALQSSLWITENTEADNEVTELKQQVGGIVSACWRQWSLAREKLQQEPWYPWQDESFPIRVLKELEKLLPQSARETDTAPKLTPAEIALVIAAPFVCEAVLANGLVKALESNPNPLSLDKTNTGNDLQIALGQVHRLHQRLVRKVQQFTENGLVLESDAVKAWLLYRCLLRTSKIWTSEPTGYLSTNFVNDLLQSSRSESSLTTRTLLQILLEQLARSILWEHETIDSRDLNQEVGFPTKQNIRMRMLCYLLKLAGLLAIDVRTLSDVLVDSIAFADRLTSEVDRLTPEEVRIKVDKADWKRSGSSYTLKVTCRHPALDFALREHVEYASTVLNHILRKIAENNENLEALSGLPVRLTTDEIEAERGKDKVPLYKTPHVYFQLAQDQIRELLMGEQLYGDPNLAIRELYQNALDACRYREARNKYLKQKPDEGDFDPSWEGKIVFTQGVEDGRPYIECKDNGIGMGVRELTQCFARAGSRFSEMPEFVEEQAKWQRCHPPIELYPNSQFGIGVFSYFMLADELLVKTCRLDKRGKPEKQLQVCIPSSGGLFRIKEGKEWGGDAGTSVRLYLSRTEHKGESISCLKVLRELLWVAEFRTEVRHGSKCEVWEPGQLRHPELSEDQYVSTGHPDVWWVSEAGNILSDGLVVETNSRRFRDPRRFRDSRRDKALRARGIRKEETPIVVINLRGANRPKLTVERKQIVEWDQTWISEVLMQGAKNLLDWSKLTLEWLWVLTEEYPYAAVQAVDLLLQESNNLKIGELQINYRTKKNFIKEKILLPKIGCFLPDYYLLTLLDDILRKKNTFIRHCL